MAALINLFVAILVLLLSCPWGLSADCTFHDIKVSTTRTGKVIQGKPEWSVTVINTSSCCQYKVTLYCKGFQSVEPVSTAFNQLGDVCLINGGHVFGTHSTIQFNYAWDNSFDLSPVSSLVSRCP